MASARKLFRNTGIIVMGISLILAFFLIFIFKSAPDSPSVFKIRLVMLLIVTALFFLGYLFMFKTRLFIRKWQEVFMLFIVSSISVLILVAFAILYSPGHETKWHDPNTRFDSQFGRSIIPANLVKSAF